MNKPAISGVTAVRLLLAYNALAQHLSRVATTTFKQLDRTPERCEVRVLLDCYNLAAELKVRGCQRGNPVFTNMNYLYNNESF